MIDEAGSKGQRIAFAGAYLEGLKNCLDAFSREELADVIDHLEEAYREGRQVFIIGNGGSAATASHLASDWGKNILPDKDKAAKRLRVTALTDNVSWITALANDLGYEYVFSEQLKNLVNKGDLVIAISGSGNSPNITEGIKVARSLGAKVIGILGFDGGKAGDMVDTAIVVKSDDYGYVEDVHMVLGHLITSYFRTRLTRTGG